MATNCVRNIIESAAYEVDMSGHYRVYCINNFNAAFEKDHKTIKTCKMKNINREGSFLMYLIYTVSILQVKLMMWITQSMNAPSYSSLSLSRICVGKMFLKNYSVQILVWNRDRLKKT